MSGFVTCAGLATALAEKQDKLTNCAGAPLVGTVPTCTETTGLIEDAVTELRLNAVNVLANDGATVLFKGLSA